MSMALVALAGTLVLLADVFFGLVPDRDAQTRALRKNVAEALAIQVAALLQHDDPRALQATFDAVVARGQDLRSLAVRRADGAILVQAGNHGAHWKPMAESERSRPEQVIVALSADGVRWGTFEMAFAVDAAGPVVRWLREPMVMLLLFMTVVGTLVFGLYMRRALQHLDPASVIPERVQGAFDAMCDGIVVLDHRGRTLMTNKAFRALHPEAAALRAGSQLSQLRWLAAGFRSDSATHPWNRAMGERAANTGETVAVGEEGDKVRQLVVSCSPITDPSGSVRGCLATFNDVSELQRANDALRGALDQLSQARDEMQRKNEELERLSTRDSLTGCLNRRAFFSAFEPRLQSARASGSTVACLMIDIDHFKAVNDNHGHGIGDRVIQEVARVLEGSFRPTDLVCRYGGEEFSVVLPNVTRGHALVVAEHVRQRVQAECAAAVPEASGLAVTISVGVALTGSAPTTATLVIDRADRALYRAKRGGRNRVCEAEDDASVPAVPGRRSPGPVPGSPDTERSTVAASGVAATADSGT